VGADHGSSAHRIHGWRCDPAHPDLQVNLLRQSSAGSFPFVPPPQNGGAPSHGDWRPNELVPSPLLGTIEHGMHVNTLMAGAWQSRTSATPLANSDMIGACPTCKFSTVRFENSNSNAAGTTTMFKWLARGTGTTALNMSFGSKNFETNELDAALGRDVVVVAAAGNKHTDASGSGSAPQFPSSYGNVISVGASDFDDKRWDERRIAGLATNKRHAGVGSDFVIQFRCARTAPGNVFSVGPNSFEHGAECGSASSQRVDVLAPGVQMIGGLGAHCLLAKTILENPTCVKPPRCWGQVSVMELICGISHPAVAIWAIREPCVHR
jgi:hypothetical protein